MAAPAALGAAPVPSVAATATITVAAADAEEQDDTVTVAVTTLARCRFPRAAVSQTPAWTFWVQRIP